MEEEQAKQKKGLKEKQWSASVTVIIWLSELPTSV
jgi:hypothetical protein